MKTSILLLLCIYFFRVNVTAQMEKPYIQKGIIIKPKGFILRSAVLFRSNGDTLKPGTLVPIDEMVTLRLHIKSGYTEVDGKVFPGGNEVIKLSNGTAILKSEDLFEAYKTTGVSFEDGQYISFKAKITSINDKKLSVITTFKLWDRKSKNEITGRFSFKVL
jgi:hypothetical protein